MAGFLDQYGAGDERREKTIRTLVISAIAIAVVAGAAFFVFHNYSEERQVKKFFELLAARDYKDAHAMFNPGPSYPMSSFLRDWGPEAGEVKNFRIVKSRSCYSNVILTVRYGQDREQVLWVDRGSLSLGFAPYDVCPPNGHPPVSAPSGAQ
jgi:hypothetical protein